MGRIITLTTDFGLKDPYVGAMKGAMLSVDPSIAIVDISHQVTPGNIVEGALILLDACRFFPKGTVHVGVVDPGVGSARKPMLVEAGDYIFVGPDNGLLSLAARACGLTRAIELADAGFFRPGVSRTFHGRDIFGPVAALLASGADPGRFGPELDEVVSLEIPAPQSGEGFVSGEVVYADSFGNLMTNIGKDDLASVGDGCEVSIAGATLSGIKKTYSDSPEGAVLALFGSSGRLEVAVNSGSAAVVLKAGVGAKVEVRRIGA